HLTGPPAVIHISFTYPETTVARGLAAIDREQPLPASVGRHCGGSVGSQGRCGRAVTAKQVGDPTPATGGGCRIGGGGIVGGARGDGRGPPRPAPDGAAAKSCAFASRVNSPRGMYPRSARRLTPSRRVGPHTQSQRV